VRLKRLPGTASEQNGNVVLAKLEGNNPAGSVKDRPALSMIRRAEQRGDIRPGATLIEPTSGNTGIALAMAAAMMGYRMVLVMPEHLSIERRQSMAAFGAQIVLTPQSGGMEMARDVAEKMRDAGKGVILDQFANPDNPLSHYEGTGPEIWRDTGGKITHFVSSMGTTGTIMGFRASSRNRTRRSRSSAASRPTARRFPEFAVAGGLSAEICDWSRVDQVIEVTQADAEDLTRRLAREEGIFAGVSSGGAMWAALQVASAARNAVIVTIVCDRGDRYLSTGIFSCLIPM